jgi:hypothetical protein
LLSLVEAAGIEWAITLIGEYADNIAWPFIITTTVTIIERRIRRTEQQPYQFLGAQGSHPRDAATSEFRIAKWARTNAVRATLAGKIAADGPATRIRQKIPRIAI